MNLLFQKNLERQNLLLDEYVSPACRIEFICLNYDSRGGALCRCDNELRAIDFETARKILLGFSRDDLKNYLHAIFDPDYSSPELQRAGEEPVFHLPELQKLKKYDLTNLAKQTLKDIQQWPEERIFYFSETDGSDQTAEGCGATALYGNTKSRVFHKPDCPSFNAITCTSLFKRHSEAVAAGFKPCRICKP